MNNVSSLTPFSAVNAALSHFNARLADLLHSRFRGMYVVGSLALGDFNSEHSDIDFIVLIDGDIEDALVNALRAIHTEFDTSNSPWAQRIEAIYITPDAFDLSRPNHKRYPQVEKGVELFTSPLEDGWVFQCYSLREYALVVSGVDPHSLIPPIDHKYMPPAVAAIASMWLGDAVNDPTWIDWLREVPHQQFVIKTLCRLLYSLATGDVASKSSAVRWGMGNLPARWVTLLEASLVNTVETDLIVDALIDETIAFVRYTFEQSQPDVNATLT